MPFFRVIEVETRAREFNVLADDGDEAIEKLRAMGKEDREKRLSRNKQIDLRYQIED